MSNTTNFEMFKEAFEYYLKTVDGGLSYVLEYGDLPFGGKVVEDKSVDVSDSYGWTNDDLTKVVYFSGFEIYVRFNGNDSSYQGIDWYNNYKEVKPNIKTITTYE